MTDALANRPTFARIDLDTLEANARSIRKFLGDTTLIPVVKANAYGHGAVLCSQRLTAMGIADLAVALPEEAAELREAGIVGPRILCLGAFYPGQEELLLRHNITPVIFDIDQAELLDRAAKVRGTVANFHVKIDTGMGRVGVPWRDVTEFAEQLRSFDSIELEGVMSHFAAADDLREAEFTALQGSRFDDAVAAFRANGFDPKMIDIANSPGAVVHPDQHRGAARIGGLLYGLAEDILPRGFSSPAVRPVLSLVTRVAMIKRFNDGDTLGYGRTFRAARDSVIATLPIGYNDGLRRVLSNRGRVLVGGRSAPIVGRVSMDWTIVDVTDIPGAAVGTEVIVIGESGSDRISAAEIGRLCDTISYEITCGISYRVPRVAASGFSNWGADV